MKIFILMMFAVITPCMANDLSPFSGQIEYRGDWGLPGQRARPYQVNLTIRGRRDELRVDDFTREIPYPSFYDQRPKSYRYKLNQTIVGHKYRTRSGAGIFGGGSSTSCHFVITRMTMNAGILETRNYHVIESTRGACPSDRDVLARFRPIEERGFSFQSGQLSDVNRYRVVNGQVSIIRDVPPTAETLTSAAAENNDDRNSDIKPASGNDSPKTPTSAETTKQ